MEIWIDADGCPREVVRITREYAARLGIKCWSVSNYHHEIPGETHIMVDDQSQSTDMEIINRCHAGDLVITQDIGLAAIALGKKCKVLGINGKEYVDHDMSILLEVRERSARIRRGGGRTRGPKKRTAADDAAFESGLKRSLGVL